MQLLWVETSIFSTAGYRLRSALHGKTLKPDGSYPTQNTMKKRKVGGGNRVWRGWTNTGVFGSIPSLNLRGGFANVTPHTSVITQLMARATVFNHSGVRGKYTVHILLILSFLGLSNDDDSISPHCFVVELSEVKEATKGLGAQ